MFQNFLCCHVVGDSLEPSRWPPDHLPDVLNHFGHVGVVVVGIAGAGTTGLVIFLITILGVGVDIESKLLKREKNSNLLSFK